MRIPDAYVRLVSDHPLHDLEPPFGFHSPALSAHVWQGPVEHSVYPPVGYFRWDICELGNGDYYGYYWPVGKEDCDPLVAFMSHDCWGLIPMASSIEALARLEPWQRDLTALVTGRRREIEANTLEDDELEENPRERPSFAEQLALDPRSPFYLVANADQAVGQGLLDCAEDLYLQAVALLPEYTAAHFGLVTVYRRSRRPEQAARWMLEAIRSPMCFQGASFWAESNLPPEPVNRADYRRKCLHWLRQTKPADAQAIANDPLFQAREKLTFATGVTTNDDFRIYEQAMEEYVGRNQAPDALRLAMLYGELMMCEATPFRERNGFTKESHQQRLLRLCQSAGLERRARILEEPSKYS